MQAPDQKQLKALLCQLSPRLKEKKANIARVKVSLQHYSHKDRLDVIVFPEMSFTGYNFKDAKDALPQACVAGEGQEFQFASAEARRLNCYILYGYIERHGEEDSVKLYNSVGVVGRNGEWLLNVRKTHLYYNDELWCEEGEGFKSIEISNLKGEKFKCAIGICMDINPKNFTSGQFEWAEYALKEKAEVLLFLTNWVDSSVTKLEDKDIVAMYNYWLHRLSPILTAPEKKPTLFLAADRVGKQYSYFDKKDTLFFGCSCAMMLNPNYIIQRLGNTDEGYLVVQTKLPK